eukprot:2159742-Pleurochrysis_carterae.AAC.3
MGVRSAVFRGVPNVPYRPFVRSRVSALAVARVAVAAALAGRRPLARRHPSTRRITLQPSGWP